MRSRLRNLAIGLALGVAGVLVGAQSITIPNTFVNGTTADAPQVNANFTALSANALNRAAGIFSGTATPASDNTIDLGSGALRFANVYATLFRGSGANLTALTAANITAGGVLPALDGSALTNLNATNLATGTVPTARLGTGTANGTTILYGDQTYKAATMTLLKAGSGTSTAAGATNVDTIAISGLTALDTLVIYATLESTTAGTADPQIYNVTDSQKWIDVFLDTAPNIPANGNGSMTIEIRQRQSGGTTIALFNYGLDVSNIFTGDWNRVTTTTAWTGSFTLALRHAGVTATGTFRYNWAVYKVAGQ